MRVLTGACLGAAALSMFMHVAEAQQQPVAPPASAAPSAPAAPPNFGLRVEIEPNALALVKAMSDRLAAAKTMTFTAVAMYESLARTGEPLAYTTLSRVALQRPDKLRVLTLGDGPPTEFYYDGKTAKAYEPTANLVAVAEAPDTIDATLLAAYQHAAIYFPFTDVIVADPLKDLMNGLQIAFVVGKSRVVGGVATDIVALANQSAHIQIWIGSDDKLPRMIRATFMGDPARFRHAVEFSDWKLDVPIPPDSFTSAALAGATRVEFARPDAPGTKTGK